jgi:hypothetical protein
VIYVLAVTNALALLALAYSLRLASQERRILFAASLQASGKTDAARRAAGPTHAEAKAAVEQQVKLAEEVKASGGVFTSQNPFGRPQKPEGI